MWGKISVIVPVYNTEEFVGECIESVLAQTYSNFELLLVNDGSTDGSLQVCERYSDGRIHILSKQNGGLSDARNYGIKHAKGDYIFFLDSDDIIHQDTLKILLEMLMKQDADISVCGIYKLYSQQDIQEFKNAAICLDQPQVILTGQDKISRMLKGLQNELTVAWTKLYSKKIWETLEFPYGKVHEDEFTAYKVVDSCEKIVFCDMKLYGYRQRNGSITHRYKRKNCLDRIEAKKVIFQYVNEGLFTEKTKSRALFLYMRTMQLVMAEMHRYEHQEPDIIDALANDYRQTYRENKKLMKFMSIYEKNCLLMYRYLNKFAIVLDCIKNKFWRV